jgi:ketosteroid isomerase-like protein
MSASDRNREAIAALHAAAAGTLSREALFALLAEDVEWSALGDPELMPWAGSHRGHAGVARWLHVLNSALQYESFELLELYADGDVVIEVVRAEGYARETGKRFASDVVRIFTFRGDEVSRVRSFYDTGAYLAALGKVAAPADIGDE